MEVLGNGLIALGDAISAIALGITVLGIAGIGAAAALIHAKDITLEELKNLFNKDRRWR